MRMHIMEQGALNQYRVIVHAPTPAGNNSAGFLWALVLINAGLAVTSMKIGASAGQITQAEADQVAAGTMIETQLVWEDNPAWTAAERTADLNARATIAVNETLTRYSALLKQYGRTVA